MDIATRAGEKMAEQRRRLERDAEEAAEHAKRSAERSAEAERRSADAERRLAEAEADAAQTRLGLGRDLEATRREATRHAVAARQAPYAVTTPSRVSPPSAGGCTCDEAAVSA